MTTITTLGRVFFGLGIVGIGVLHFFFPGIRPIIIPGLSEATPTLTVAGTLVGILLIVTGLFITIGIKHHILSLFMGIAFLILALFVHLPAYLHVGRPLWVNLNKVVALSGGFFLVSRFHERMERPKILVSLSKVSIIGKYLFAIMLLAFSLGHLFASKALSTLVPPYIPSPQFWTFLGGIALAGSAVSIVTNIRVEKITLLLAAVLFIWLVALHLYYTILHPAWQEGENFIGLFTCLSFCGTALLISQQAKKK